jgi:hypothetical protein
VLNLQQSIESDKDIERTYLENENNNTDDMSNEALQKLLNNNYTAISKAILRHTKQSLPLIKPGQNPRNSSEKLIALRADRKDLVDITRLATSDSIISRLIAENRLQVLFDKYSPEDLEDSPNKTKYIIKKINQHIGKHKKKQIAEHIIKRQTEFAMNQKKHINSIMDKRIEFDCAKDPTTNEITTDQKEVEQLAVDYFHAKMTKVQNPSPNPVGTFIDMTKVNAPLSDVIDEFWDSLMLEINNKDILDALKTLPKNKATGLDAISNEILQLVVTPGSKLIDIIRR